MPISDRTASAAARAAAVLFPGGAARAAALVVLGGMLAGCQMGLPAGLGLGLGRGGPSGPGQIAVARGDVTVAAPVGYCLDRALSRPQAADPFVAFLPCAEGQDLQSVPGLILTATVGQPADLPPADALAEALSSAAGRAAMARSGLAGDVTVHQTMAADGTVFLHLGDTSAAGSGPVVETDYWRAVLAVAGRPVTLTAMSPAGRPVPPDAMLGRLATFATQIRGANVAPAETAAPRTAQRS